MAVKESFENLRETMQNDHEYAWSWHANLAVCMQDEGVSWEQSNIAASRIMQHFFGVNTGKIFPERMIK